MMSVSRNSHNTLSRRNLLGAVVAIVAIAGIGLSGAVIAGEKTAAATTAYPLWIMEKDGHTVYLVGQTPPRNSAWRDARIEGLLNGSGEIWTETNKVRRNKPPTEYLMNPAKPLSDYLSTTDLSRVKRAAEIAQVQMEQIAPLRPWTAAATLESAYFQAEKLDLEGTVESVLLRAATLEKIPHSSEFEAQDDVVQFMGEMSAQEDVQFLQYTLDRILAGVAENERIYAAWARGDAGPATEFVASMKSAQPQLYAKHVVERNRRWLPRFDAMQKKAKPSLVIVGLFHMVGPDSLVEQLKKDGWSVRRTTEPPKNLPTDKPQS